MACNITSWSINGGASSIYVGASYTNCLELYGSNFDPAHNLIGITCSGYTFSNFWLDASCTTEYLKITFTCTQSSQIQGVAGSGDVQVNLTNPDCSTSCPGLVFSLAPPPPPPNGP